MNEIKGVVLHWDGGQPKSIEALQRWLRKHGNGRGYHRYIKGNNVVYGADTRKKQIHCGAYSYTHPAVRYFGAYCPDWNHKEKPHKNSPNNCTIGICMLHDYDGGKYSNETLLTSAKISAQMLSYYDLNINGLWTHHMVTGKSCPKFFVDHPEQWEVFKDMVNHYIGG